MNLPAGRIIMIRLWIAGCFAKHTVHASVSGCTEGNFQDREPTDAPGMKLQNFFMVLIRPVREKGGVQD
jgi:hypothetical protein